MRLLPLLLLVLALTAGCTPNLPTVPSAPRDDSGFVAGTAPPAKPGIDDSTEDHGDVICPGDVLTVRTFGSQEMAPTVAGGLATDTLGILTDRGGKIHVPLLGDIPVAGLSVVQAEALVQERLSKIDRFGRVALDIGDPRGHFAIVTGAVAHAGNISLVGDARLADVLSSAGGPQTTQANGQFLAIGDIDAARVIRKGVTLQVDAHLAMEGNPRHNVRVRPGDIIVVPPLLRGRIAVIGHVGSPQTLGYHSGYRLLEAIADCGGVPTGGDTEDVRILRGGYDHPKVFVANLPDLLAGRRPDVALAPGDVIYVTEHWTGTMERLLDQTVPAIANAIYIKGAL